MMVFSGVTAKADCAAFQRAYSPNAKALGKVLGNQMVRSMVAVGLTEAQANAVLTHMAKEKGDEMLTALPTNVRVEYMSTLSNLGAQFNCKN